MRQGTGQVEGEVQGDRLENYGAHVGVGGDEAEDGDEEWVEEEEEHSGPPGALLGEGGVVDEAPGNSCDSHQSSRVLSVGNQGLALPRTSKSGQGGGQGIDSWEGVVQEGKRQEDHGEEVEDGEQLELEDEQRQGGHRGEEDVEVHGDVNGHVELDGAASCDHGGEDGGSCHGEESGGPGWHGDDGGGGEHGLHAEAHGGEVEEHQAAPRSVQLALHDKDQPPPRPGGRILFSEVSQGLPEWFPKAGKLRC